MGSQRVWYSWATKQQQQKQGFTLRPVITGGHALFGLLISSFPNTICFPHCIFLAPLPKISWSYIHEFIPRLYSVPSVYVCQSLGRVQLCDPMDCSTPGSSVHGILQARILQWIAIAFSRGSFWPRDQTQVSHITGKFFTIWVTSEASICLYVCLYVILFLITVTL